ncbi:MAG: hypothetical protein Q7S83_00075 [bacterium]|nr:hypothetical protein [bacterium]
MKIGVFLASILIAVFLSIQLFNFYKGNSILSLKLEEAVAESDRLGRESMQLKADLEYFSEPENLAKELRAKFDYKKPGEKLIKIQ